MEKPKNIILVSYQISSLSFYAGPPPGEFANLNKQAGFESAGWTKALGTWTRTKKTTNWSTKLCQPFEVSNAKRKF